MKSKAVVSAIMALSLAVGGFSFAQGNGYENRNDGERNGQAQRQGQQDKRNNQARQPNRSQNQGRANNNARQGSLQVELLAASRRHGLMAYRLTPVLEDILREVAAGHPVLVFENLSLPIYPVWHYAVVVGFDHDRNILVLHSGKTEALEMSLFTFERTWVRGGNWAIVVLPPNRLPVTANADALAQSAAALEPADAQAAHIAYATALTRWPDHKALLLGLGNTDYALGRLADAASAYQAAVQVHADFADGWNNLAQVQMELGRHQEAADAIAKAVTLGGPRLARYLELAQTIQAK